jgi:hypothetical protein
MNCVRRQWEGLVAGTCCYRGRLAMEWKTTANAACDNRERKGRIPGDLCSLVLHDDTIGEDGRLLLGRG